MLHIALNAAAGEPLLFGVILVVVALALVVPTAVALHRRKRRIGDTVAIVVGLVIAALGAIMFIVGSAT